MVARSAMTEALAGCRAFWISAALLPIALPLAVAAHAWGDWREWRSETERVLIQAKPNTSVRYANAEWVLTRVAGLSSNDTASMIVLAEFEARPDDAAALAKSPCTVRLVDQQGRAWQPVLFADPALRRAAPEAASKPACGGGAFASLVKGGTAKMAVSFTVPRSAEGIGLEISIAAVRPDILVFRSDASCRARRPGSLPADGRTFGVGLTRPQNFSVKLPLTMLLVSVSESCPA